MRLNTRVGELIAQIPAAWGIDADGATGPDAGSGPGAAGPARGGAAG